MAKIQPSVLQLKFIIPESATNYIDLSQCASVVNRRFYRQGLNWAVAGFKLMNPTPLVAPNSGLVTISKIPQTWVASNAWHKAFAHWKKQQDDAVDDSGAQSAVARYRDFKIHADTAQVTAGFSANLRPVDLADTPYLQGEWQPSQIVLPNIVADASGSEVDPQEYLLHMVGDNNFGGVSRGIIDGYANSRSYPQSPDPVHADVAGFENWMMKMENVGNDFPEIVANATDRNDELPYDQAEYPGGETNAPVLEQVHEVKMVPTFGDTTRRLAGTNVPCGLLKITNISPASLEFYVTLVPGESRGYLTQPMQDM